MAKLTQQQVETFHRDGYYAPVDVFGVDEARRWRADLEDFERTLPPGPVSAGNRRKLHVRLPWARDLVEDPRLLDVMESILGPDILVFTSTFFIKEPHSPTIAAWHQDSTYYGIEPKEEVTVWVALTEASEAAGCMEALSYRGKPRQLSHVSRAVRNSVNRAAQVITEPLDAGSPVAMPLQPGWFSMHHGLCPHRSGPNTSSHRRIGLGLNYIPTHTRPSGTIRQAAMLVRGTDRYGNFESVDWPREELGKAEVATHERAISLYRDGYLEEEARHAKLSA